MDFDTEHFANREEELDFYRCLTPEQRDEDHAEGEALLAGWAEEYARRDKALAEDAEWLATF